jgi:hypothetical protein
MRRRDFLRHGLSLGVAGTAGGALTRSLAAVPAHNWDRYDFGPGPQVLDRLNQGPFSQYVADATIPNDEVVMATTASALNVPNFGRGLITYITADMGLKEIQSDHPLKAIEDLVRFPLGQLLYVRPTWRELQPAPGRLQIPEYLELILSLAKSYRKRIGIRVQMSAPDYWNEPALPDFVLARVPTVKLVSDTPEAKHSGERFLKNPYARYQPRFDHPYFQQAFRELVALLAAELDGNAAVEFVDTFMYGYWGEGHTWPFGNNPFPDYATAERTWVNMLNVQVDHFPKTPLLTNTQPDFSRVGNSELVDRTVRSNNWLRSDTIFIENEQIEALSNRPAWTAAAIEQAIRLPPAGASVSPEDPMGAENVISHVLDVGANYLSLWNFHDIGIANLSRTYEASRAAIDLINRRIGYNVRPSFVWAYKKDGRAALIIGFANDGIAGVPGVLRVVLETPDGKSVASGCLDPGYPLPGKIRQAQFVLPEGVAWQGSRLRAELQVKSSRHRVWWNCQQALNSDGSLTLRPNMSTAD